MPGNINNWWTIKSEIFPNLISLCWRNFSQIFRYIFFWQQQTNKTCFYGLKNLWKLVEKEIWNSLSDPVNSFITNLFVEELVSLNKYGWTFLWCDSTWPLLSSRTSTPCFNAGIANWKFSAAPLVLPGRLIIKVFPRIPDVIAH